MKNSEKFRIKPSPYFEGVKLELYSNTRAVVEGCTGILSYNDEAVKIKASKMNLCFTGRSLRISCLDKESLIVEGFIMSVQYIM